MCWSDSPFKWQRCCLGTSCLQTTKNTDVTRALTFIYFFAHIISAIKSLSKHNFVQAKNYVGFYHTLVRPLISSSLLSLDGEGSLSKRHSRWIYREWGEINTKSAALVEGAPHTADIDTCFAGLYTCLDTQVCYFIISFKAPYTNNEMSQGIKNGTVRDYN